jgi:hypothetical protein
MPKSSKVPAKVKLKGLSLNDPRVAMRIVMGVLLAANLAMAVVAFKPFGGSADDLRQEQGRLSNQLRQMKSRLEGSRDHVAKIEVARTQADEFMAKYIQERRAASARNLEEMSRIATEANVRFLPESAERQSIEGSDTLQMELITAGFDGTYAGLAKLVNALEKSPRFLIIDSMVLNAPQQQNVIQAGGQQNVNITLKLVTFVRDEAGSGE